MVHVLKTLLGEHAVTSKLKRGEISSPLVALDFADVKVPNTAFKRVVRTLDFDVAELAIATFLMAKAQGVPLTLLPVVVMARSQHPYLVHDATRGTLHPRNLEGRRVVLRSWSVTTAMWIRDILARDYGVDISRIRWSTMEDAHVADFADPAGVTRLPPGTDPLELLRSGAADAAVVGAIPADPRFQSVIPDAPTAASEWQQNYGAIQINHMLVMKTDLCRTRPEIAAEVWRMIAASRNASSSPSDSADLIPFGRAACARNLEVAIEAAYAQRLIPRRFDVAELYDGLPAAVG